MFSKSSANRMGDSACVMHGFKYANAITNESIQENPKHALGESISFGRFMTDQSLSWEKWSTFSHKKYVEEAERYAQPGSVAQKKAFFEAHYKKIAAQKAAALLEQENAAKTEADNNAYHEEQTKNLNSYVDVKMEEVKIQAAKEDDAVKSNEHSLIAAVESGKQGEYAVNTAKQHYVATEDISSEKSKTRSSALSSLIPSIQKKTWKVQSTPAKPITPHLKKENKSRLDSADRKRSSSKSLLALMNLVPLKEPDRDPSKKTFKEKAGNKFKKLSCSFCFKAQPLLDSCKDGQTSRNQIKKTPTAEPESAENRATKDLSKKNVDDQRKFLTNSLPERITHENASPIIQQ